MTQTHECHQLPAISDARQQASWANEEIYTGRLGRQPLITRMDRAERITNTLAYVCTALLIATLIAAGTVFLQLARTRATLAQSYPVPQYEPSHKN